ncbi:MAG: hypothetical protein AAGF87_05605 [Bacteroidota bacterium]
MAGQTPRILIVEPLDHIEVVARWSRYFADECKTEVILALNKGHFKWAEKALPDFKCFSLVDIPVLLPEVDLTILVTIGNEPGKWWPLLSQHRYWVVGHNLSHWLGGPIYDYRPKNLARIIRDRWQRPKLLKLLQSAQYVLVPTYSMCDYLLRRRPEWPVVTLPFSFVPKGGEREHRQGDGSSLKIFIPGRIDTRFRDYRPVIEAIRLFPPNSQKITLVLAGRIVSQHIVNQFASMAPWLELVYQQDGLDDQAFHRHLTDCDLVIAPLRWSVRSGAYREFLGHTKISGAIFDAIAANKVLLLPDWHPRVWSRQSGYGNGADLIKLING